MRTDISFWDKTYIILIDECIRYCTATRINSKLSSEWLRALFVGWVKFFGPTTILASDQEGAITSDQVGIACEKFGIKLDLGGSYGHMAAPVAERRLAIKLCVVKL